MQNKPYYFQMSVKATVTEEGEVRVRGLASTPDLDRYRDIVEPEAFTKALKTYMRNPVVLRSHDSDRPVGTVESAQVTDKGLSVEAVIKDAAMAEEVKAGLFKAFSIGYIPLKTELRNKDNEPLGVEDNPWAWDNIRVIKELDLVEISIVATPANPGALFNLSKSLKEFGRKLAFKALDLNAKDATGIPDNEVTNPEKPEESEGDEEEQVEDGEEAEKPTVSEEDIEAGEKAAEAQGTEAPVEGEERAEGEEADESEATDEEAGEANEETDESEEDSEESQEDAENAGETTATEGGEGGDTEAPSAGAEPADDKDESEEDSEGKAIIVSKDVAALLPSLKDAGALREPEGEEKAQVIPKEVLTLMRKLHDVLVAENERANTEKKRADDLQVKLNGTPAKKALASHRQFAAEEGNDEKTVEAVTKAKKKASSERFMSLFKTH